MGAWLGAELAVILFQLISAMLLYFIFRRRLPALATGLILFVLTFGVGCWTANRIVTNYTLRDHVEELQTGKTMSQGERMLFTVAMLHAPGLKSAVNQRAALMALPGALLITLSGFLCLRRRYPVRRVG